MKLTLMHVIAIGLGLLVSGVAITINRKMGHREGLTQRWMGWQSAMIVRMSGFMVAALTLRLISQKMGRPYIRDSSSYLWLFAVVFLGMVLDLYLSVRQSSRKSEKPPEPAPESSGFVSEVAGTRRTRSKK